MLNHCGDTDHWAQAELDHINRLKLQVILLGLRSLCNNYCHNGIFIRSGNITVVVYIDQGGSTQFNLNSIVGEIFDWALSRVITLSTDYFLGIDYVGLTEHPKLKL